MRYECIALPTELSWHWYKCLFVGLCVEFIRLMAEVIALPTELSWHWYKRLFVGLCVEFIRLMAEVIALPTELSWLYIKQEEYTGNTSFFQAAA